MPKPKLKRIEEKWDRTSAWVKRIITVFSTIGIIGGAVAGIVGWTTAQIDRIVESKLDVVTSQIAELEQNLQSEVKEVKSELSASENDSKLSRTRLELNTLISHNPTNIIEIEKVARYYFLDLGGDWYMSQIYSDWAREYSGDLTFVTK